MAVTIDHKDGWLFPDARKNAVHEIDVNDLNELLKMANADEMWAESVRQQVYDRLQAKNDGTWKNRPRTDWIVEELQVMNSPGTVFHFPFGLRIITFASKRHLFRGENKRYPSTVPSLNRALSRINGSREKELYRVIAYMRKWRFADLIWQINVVPYWEAKISDVHIDALAQHYGFQTHLLDLTNDFKTALFFATTKYDYVSDSFFPLTEEDIEKSEDTKYGYIYHAPDWTIDFFNGGGFMDWSFKHLHNGNYNEMPDRNRRFFLQSGDMDGVALQIGFQPLHRCHNQSGYVFPMRNEVSLQENTRFEKLRFRQSAQISKQVFDLMDGGKKVFPNEGISEIRNVVEELKHSVIFSNEHLEAAYYADGVDKNIFPTIDALRKAIDGFITENGPIEIRQDRVEDPIPQELLDKVNSHYDDKDLGAMIGGMFHQKPEDRKYREQRCIEIYGKLI